MNFIFKQAPVERFLKVLLRFDGDVLDDFLASIGVPKST
jgi:hypothetical protein